jgi:hypothetical protein
LCYAEHEKARANAAYVPVLTGECQVIAGFSAFRRSFSCSFYKKMICERHLSRSSGLGNIQKSRSDDWLQPGRGATLLGRGSHATGYYSINFDSPQSLAEFVEHKKNDLSEKQYAWVQWTIHDGKR